MRTPSKAKRSRRAREVVQADGDRGEARPEHRGDVLVVVVEPDEHGAVDAVRVHQAR